MAKARNNGKWQTINDMCVKHIIDLMAIDSSDEDEEDEIMELFNANMISLLSNRRTTHFHVPKSNVWRTSVLHEFDEGRVRHMLRIDNTEFEHILNLIKEDPVFTNKKNVPQIPIALQLEITFYILGYSGEGASVRKCSSIFGLGDGGTLHIITKRVIKSIINLKEKFLFWPNEFERELIIQKKRNELPGCVGYIDGTEIKLAESPARNHELYYSRKRQYSLKMQAVCDYKLRIRQATIGYPGSVHDAKIFAKSPIARTPEIFFSNSQWIAGDSAYPLKTNIITPFRQNSNEMTKKMRENFNEYFSKYRVRIENCFGQLKERFGSLKELRFILHTTENKIECNNWILATCILHNILIDLNDPVDEIDNDFGQNNTFELPPQQNIRLYLVNYLHNRNM